MYSFSSVLLRAFFISVSLIAFNVSATQGTGSNAASGAVLESRLQESIKVLKGQQSALNTGQALNFLQSAETHTNLKLRGQALLWLGRVYRDGLAGTGKDSKRAFSFFERAAGKEGGDPSARYELAQAYYQGDGTDRNLMAAYMWVSLSLHQESGVSGQAKELQERVAGLLSEDQLAIARILITQMESLYLNQ